MQKAKEMGVTADLEVIKAMEKMRQDRKLPSMEALEKEIVAQGYTVDEVKENIRTRYLTESVIQREVYSRVTITTDDVRKYYDEHQKDFDKPAGVHLREITVITENRGPEEVASQKKKIEDALAAVKKGDDFATVASKYSESQTASEGGDFGFFTKGELSPSLEQVVSKLDKGQVTEVLPVVGAFMLIKLDAKHDGGILPFELAQKEITDTLWRKAIPPKVKEYLAKLRNEGYIRLAEGYVDSEAPAAAEKVSELK
jgi:parvulin-like peptidyl-prolyl isomerase